jgi:hypothetical protein
MDRLEIDKIINTNICIHKKDQSEFNLKKSVMKYGQLRPIIINQNNEIIDGHKLYRVCKELKLIEVWIKKIDTNKKEQIYCELNMIKTELDAISFFKYVRDYVDLEDHCLPFNKRELKDFVELLKFDWNTFNKKQNLNKLF